MTPAEIAVVVTRLDAMKEQQDRIEAHVERTNGRVSRLELKQARYAGALSALALGLPAVSALIVWAITH